MCTHLSSCACLIKVEIKFYLDDLEDELTITALRMLVKDLLILFQAGNEGVINVLGARLFTPASRSELTHTLYRELFRDVTGGCR